MGAKEVTAQHAERILINFDPIFLQLFEQESLHELATSSGGFFICVVECFGMNLLQQIIKLGPIGIRQAN